jgi:tetratricopeptide (TPR) repeat protein
VTDSAAARAIELLIEEAWSAYRESRYPLSASVAGRAVLAAKHLGDPNLHIRALQREADALRMSGNDAEALSRMTRILGMAADHAIAASLDATATREVARAYAHWVDSAIYLGGFPVRELFGVLDAADHWLTTTGHRDWRAAVLLDRAALHRHLGELDQALVAAQDAFATYRSGAPGYSLAVYRQDLGELLHLTGRPAEAEQHFHAILNDSATNPHSRASAWKGLAWCALACDDVPEALRYANAAVDSAEALGSDSLTVALEVLTAAQRAAGNLDAAWEAATRRLDFARSVGTHYRLYYAMRSAVDIAIDRADHASARALLDEFHQHAAALDTDSTDSGFTAEVARRRERLARSEGRTE